MCLEMISSWCGQVNWGNCGIPWVNCAVLCLWKTTGKDSSEAYAIYCQNCAVYSFFPSGMISHSKVAQFNWECIGRLIRDLVMSIAADAIRSILNLRLTCVKIFRSITRSKLCGYMQPLPYTSRIGDQFFKARCLLYIPPKPFGA